MGEGNLRPRICPRVGAGAALGRRGRKSISISRPQMLISVDQARNCIARMKSGNQITSLLQRQRSMISLRAASASMSSSSSSKLFFQPFRCRGSSATHQAGIFHIDFAIHELSSSAEKAARRMETRIVHVNALTNAGLLPR